MTTPPVSGCCWPDVTTRARTASSWGCSRTKKRAARTWSICGGQRRSPAQRAGPAEYRGARREGGWSARRVAIKRRSVQARILDKTRTPLTTWFEAAWHLTTAKNGLSAQTLERTLGTSYRVAWTMLQRYRVAMVRAEREPLSGTVEVDESLVGGLDRGGKPGRGARKSVVAIAVEVKDPGVRAGPDAPRPRCLGCQSGGSYATLWLRVPWYTPTAGRATMTCPSTATCARKRCSRHRTTPPMSRCQAFIASLACSSGGSSAPTRARSIPATCSPTWKSSPSGSTAALRVLAGWSSVDSLSRQSSLPPSRRPPSPTVTTGELDHKMLGVEELTVHPPFYGLSSPRPTATSCICLGRRDRGSRATWQGVLSPLCRGRSRCSWRCR